MGPGGTAASRLARKHVPDSDPGTSRRPPRPTSSLIETVTRHCQGPPIRQGEGRNPGLARNGLHQWTRHHNDPPHFQTSACRHQPAPRLARKHVPDSDPGCALQSTSMPALHRRNVPNCKPMVDGGTSKCSAGACPPLGSGWGVAESDRANSLYQPQLRLFKPRRAGTSRHQRLARKHVPDSDPGYVAPVKLMSPGRSEGTRNSQPHSSAIPLSHWERAGVRVKAGDQSRNPDRGEGRHSHPNTRNSQPHSSAISLSRWERAGVRVKAGVRIKNPCCIAGIILPTRRSGQRKCRLWTRN